MSMVFNKANVTACMMTMLILLLQTVGGQTPSDAISRQLDGLVGVEKFKVQVVYAGEALERHLKRSTLETNVSTYLVRRGVTVVRPPFPPKLGSATSINVIITSALSADGMYLGYALSTSVQENAILIRDQEIQIPVITWILRTGGTITPANTKFLQDQLNDQLDLLIDDWKRVNLNSKTPSPKKPA